MWIIAIISAGLITAFIHLCIIGFNAGVATICSTILLHQFVVTSGLIGILGFYTNVWAVDKIDTPEGWPKGPFQLKYGFAQLGVGVMGLLSIWFRGQFWIATLITLYIYGLSGLCTHTVDLKRKQRNDPVEIANIVLDIIYHIALTVLSFYVPGVWQIG